MCIRDRHQDVQEQQLRSGGVRTAMSIEIRDGILCAFMPPVEKLEDYLELVTAVESTAEEMAMQVHIEGYPPPFDPRVEVIKVTPDPGVIEINIQPATSWHESVDITFGLYEDAAKVRLGANRFLVDGRHTGTGGGNHVAVSYTHLESVQGSVGILAAIQSDEFTHAKFPPFQPALLIFNHR